jgi:hypothetical protein
MHEMFLIEEHEENEECYKKMKKNDDDNNEKGNNRAKQHLQASLGCGKTCGGKRRIRICKTRRRKQYNAF